MRGLFPVSSSPGGTVKEYTSRRDDYPFKNPGVAGRQGCPGTGYGLGSASVFLNASRRTCSGTQ